VSVAVEVFVLNRRLAHSVAACALAVGLTTVIGGGWLAAQDGVPDISFREQSAPGDEGYQVPTLTQQQIVQASEVVRKDERALQLLRRSPYTLEPFPVIDSASGSEDVVAVGLMITFENPISIEGVWTYKHDLGPADQDGLRSQDVLEYMPECSAPNGVVRAVAMVDAKQRRLALFEPMSEAGHDIKSRNCAGGVQ